MAINRAEQEWPEEMVYDLDGVEQPKIGLLNNTMPQFIQKCYAALQEESEAEMERRTR